MVKQVEIIGMPPTDEQLEHIHRASLDILANTGIRLNHGDALNLLRRNGIRISGETAYFKPDQLMAWVGLAPARINVHARNECYDMAICADMRSGEVSIGTPSFSLMAAYGARLAKRYGLPCRGGGASTDAAAVGVQSGYESMLAMLVSCREKIDLVLHSTGILDSYSAVSTEQFFVDREIIRMVEYYHVGVTVDADTLALDAIGEVGPGGQFLTHRHTLAHCRTAPWVPELGGRHAPVGQALMEKIAQFKAQTLADYRQPAMDEAVIRELQNFLSGKGLEEGLLARIFRYTSGQGN